MYLVWLVHMLSLILLTFICLSVCSLLLYCLYCLPYKANKLHIYVVSNLLVCTVAVRRPTVRPQRTARRRPPQPQQHYRPRHPPDVSESCGSMCFCLSTCWGLHSIKSTSPGHISGHFLSTFLTKKSWSTNFFLVMSLLQTRRAVENVRSTCP